MGTTTKIAWADSTWNPLRGCDPIGPGCKNCYAARLAARNLPNHRSPATGKPFAIMIPSGPRWTGEVELIENQLEVPLHWQRPRRIFVNSMSDTFHAKVQDEWLDRVFAVMALCSQHTFICPTKRISGAREYLSNRQLFQRIHEQIKARMGYSNPKRPAVNQGDPPLPNVILLASIANQADADRDIPILLDTPVAVRGISLEPMIGPVDLTPWLTGWSGRNSGLPSPLSSALDRLPDLPRLAWVICGGESGPGARPCNVEWIRDVVRQCRETGVPCFVKQLGARPVMELCADPLDGWPNHVEVARDVAPPYGVRFILHDRAGADPAEWPDDLRVQQFPEVRNGA